MAWSYLLTGELFSDLVLLLLQVTDLLLLALNAELQFGGLVPITFNRRVLCAAVGFPRAHVKGPFHSRGVAEVKRECWANGVYGQLGVTRQTQSQRHSVYLNHLCFIKMCERLSYVVEREMGFPGAGCQVGVCALLCLWLEDPPSPSHHCWLCETHCVCFLLLGWVAGETCYFWNKEMLSYNIVQGGQNSCNV